MAACNSGLLFSYIIYSTLTRGLVHQLAGADLTSLSSLLYSSPWLAPICIRCPLRPP